MSDNTGGPAFPFIDSASPLEHPGMTLRDYFAAKALLSPNAPAISLMTLANGENVIDSWPCEWAYKVADAMLKARKEIK